MSNPYTTEYQNTPTNHSNAWITPVRTTIHTQ